MDPNIFSKMLIESGKRIESAKGMEKKRDLYGRMQGPTDYFVGVKGLRGVGKTTLLLQCAAGHREPLYFSADAIYLKGYSIYEIVDYARENGEFGSFFIDEVHFKKDWAQSLKTLYDEGVRNVFFSGSSAIEITRGADLSRRAVLFELPPATFREYLSIRKGIELPALGLEELLREKGGLAKEYSQAYEFMGEYNRYGGFLYDKKEFDEKLKNALVKLASIDLAYLRNININTENDVFRIYDLVATSSSLEMNYSRLASALGISKNTAIRLVADLEKTGGITICRPCKKGYALIREEPKLFLPIPLTSFFSRKLAAVPNVGRMREEFFVSHAGNVCYRKTERGEKTPDFMLGGKTFEVGGVSKTTIQKPDYVVADGLEASGNRIPLFLFGFLRNRDWEPRALGG